MIQKILFLTIIPILHSHASDYGVPVPVPLDPASPPPRQTVIDPALLARLQPLVDENIVTHEELQQMTDQQLLEAVSILEQNKQMAAANRSLELAITEHDKVELVKRSLRVWVAKRRTARAIDQATNAIEGAAKAAVAVQENPIWKTLATTARAAAERRAALATDRATDAIEGAAKAAATVQEKPVWKSLVTAVRAAAANTEGTLRDVAEMNKAWERYHEAEAVGSTAFDCKVRGQPYKLTPSRTPKSGHRCDHHRSGCAYPTYHAPSGALMFRNGRANVDVCLNCATHLEDLARTTMSEPKAKGPVDSVSAAVDELSQAISRDATRVTLESGAGGRLAHTEAAAGDGLIAEAHRIVEQMEPTGIPVDQERNREFGLLLGKQVLDSLPTPSGVMSPENIMQALDMVGIFATKARETIRETTGRGVANALDFLAQNGGSLSATDQLTGSLSWITGSTPAPEVSRQRPITITVTNATGETQEFKLTMPATVSNLRTMISMRTGSAAENQQLFAIDSAEDDAKPLSGSVKLDCNASLFMLSKQRFEDVPSFREEYELQGLGKGEDPARFLIGAALFFEGEKPSATAVATAQKLVTGLKAGDGLPLAMLGEAKTEVMDQFVHDTTGGMIPTAGVEPTGEPMAVIITTLYLNQDWAIEKVKKYDHLVWMPKKGTKEEVWAYKCKNTIPAVEFKTYASEGTRWFQDAHTKAVALPLGRGVSRVGEYASDGELDAAAKQLAQKRFALEVVFVQDSRHMGSHWEDEAGNEITDTLTLKKLDKAWGKVLKQNSAADKSIWSTSADQKKYPGAKWVTLAPTDMLAKDADATLKMLVMGEGPLERVEAAMKIYIPKFEIDMTAASGNMYDIKKVLGSEELGLGGIFETPLEKLTPGGNLFIDKVKHQAKLIVSKDGVKFAAATSFEMVSKGTSPAEAPLPELTIDGPYIMSIVVRDTEGKEPTRLIAMAYQGAEKPNPGED